VQAVLVVVGEGRTRRDDLLRTLELLRDVPNIGTVLNGTREPIDTYY
jgi:protein-tyrosine kinase